MDNEVEIGSLRSSGTEEGNEGDWKDRWEDCPVLPEPRQTHTEYTYTHTRNATHTHTH